jgi:hypothetical protein
VRAKPKNGWDYGDWGGAPKTHSSIFSPKAKKSRINLKSYSEFSTKTQRILDNCVKFVALIIGKIIANAIYKRIFGFFFGKFYLC